MQRSISEGEENGSAGEVVNYKMGKDAASRDSPARIEVVVALMTGLPEMEGFVKNSAVHGMKSPHDAASVRFFVRLIKTVKA